MCLHFIIKLDYKKYSTLTIKVKCWIGNTTAPMFIEVCEREYIDLTFK